jgi:hypothetical protein
MVAVILADQLAGSLREERLRMRIPGAEDLNGEIQK